MRPFQAASHSFFISQFRDNKMIPHILFAEDDPDTREVVCAILNQAGFRVSMTGRPSEVLTLAAKESFDAFLLDNWMPELSGIELCRQIRTFDQSTPILFCSGAVTQADKDEAVLVGAQGYVGKPFEPDDLIGALRAALRKS
jgi:two-component system OmpR family response regulator